MTDTPDTTDAPPSDRRNAQAAKKAGHVPTKTRSLGYARNVCAVCRSDWPCAEMAQAREDDDATLSEVTAPAGTDTTITIGWTKPDPSTGYSNFDGYRPGADQHTETIHVELPTGDLASVTRVADAVFEATNAPELQPGTAAHAIARAIAQTGYRGEGAHYSLSVGDTVTYAATTVACAPSGWQLIDHAALAEAAGFDTTSSASRQYFIDTGEYLRTNRAETEER